MSGEEDTELRDLVAQALENNGVLPKIRAELRSNVFLALEETKGDKKYQHSDQMRDLLKSDKGSLILNLIKEFLEFYELEFTLAVFSPETNYETDYHDVPQETLLQKLNINKKDISNDVPVLVNIVNLMMLDLKNKNLTAVGSPEEVKIESPGLNSTYNLPADVNNTPVSVRTEESSKSVEEEVLSNKSSDLDESHSTSTMGEEDEEEGSVQTPNDLLSPFKIIKSTPPSSKNTTSQAKDDLLLFTPDKTKSTTVKDKLEPNKTSMLGDLPPLTGNKDKTSKIDEIKALIDTSVENIEEENMSSISSKDSKDMKDVDECVDKSVKSEKSESLGEEFDDDVSELLRSQASSESVLTADETISRTSNVGDYMESV